MLVLKALGLSRRGDEVRERVLLLGVVTLAVFPEVVHLADLSAGFLDLAVVDPPHVFDHAGTLVFGSGVVDAAAHADVETTGERRAVGDAEGTHRGGEVLRVTLLAGLIAHAVKGSGEVDEGPRVAQPLFVLVVDVVAGEAQQHEFLGREVAVDRNVRRCGHRVGAVEPVEACQQEADAESDIRRVVGAGGDAPVDLFFESSVDVRAAVIVDDAADESRAFHRGGEGRRVGRPDVFGVRMCLGLPDLR